jgi:hypothetical protein
VRDGAALARHKATADSPFHTAQEPSRSAIVTHRARQLRLQPVLVGCVLVQATGVRIGALLQTMATIICGLVIAFVYHWQCALFVLGILPFKIIGFVMQVRIAAGFSMKNKADLEEAGKVRVPYRAIEIQEKVHQLQRLFKSNPSENKLF